MSRAVWEAVALGRALVLAWRIAGGVAVDAEWARMAS